MKKRILIILMLLFIVKIAWSQNLKIDGIVKAHKQAYVTKTTGKHKLIVNNKDNVLQNRKQKLAPTSISYFEKTDKASLLKIFNLVFNEARIKQLLPENGIFINYYVNPQGKILEVSFYLNDNTLLTPVEIENLEAAIKSNISFKLLPNETKGGDFFVISQFARYDKVIDRTLQ